MPKSDDTPLMQQWRDAKARHPDALVFFRVGDFYEMFYEDAQEGARLLGLTLTSRNNGAAAGVPLAGVPVRARDEYLEKLVRLGRRVAVCEQMEDPALAKGIVRREVVETVTPGAVLADTLLAARRNNFLVALAPGAASPGDAAEGDVAYEQVGLAGVDITTGEVVAAVCAWSALEAELARLEPAELLVTLRWESRALPGGEAASRTCRADWLFEPSHAGGEIQRRYRVRALDGFGFQPGDEPAIGALGALLSYLSEVQPSSLDVLRAPRLERPGEAMALDEMTRRNLELVEPLRGDLGGTNRPGRAGTLIEVVDETQTAMGARLLRRWLLRPLLLPSAIWARQGAVAALLEDPALRRRVRAELKEIRDLERLAGKVAAARVLPRELRALGDSLARV
ncbi:MAG TPA: hypothetical protein VF832_07550, partial [Longimicrobiales bacterium]